MNNYSQYSNNYSFGSESFARQQHLEAEAEANERLLRLQRSLHDLEEHVEIVKSENDQLCTTLDELHHGHNVLQQELHEVSHATSVSLQVLAANEARVAALQQQLEVSEDTLRIFAQSLDALVAQEKSEAQRAAAYYRRIRAMQSLLVRPSGPSVKLSNSQDVQRLLKENDELEAQLMKREAQRKAAAAQLAQERAVEAGEEPPTRRKAKLPLPPPPVVAAPSSPAKQHAAAMPMTMGASVTNASMSMMSNEVFVDDLLQTIESEHQTRGRLSGLGVDRMQLGNSHLDRMRVLEMDHQRQVDQLLEEFATKKATVRQEVIDRERLKTHDPSSLMDVAGDSTREEDRLRLAAKVVASKHALDDDDATTRTRLKQCSAAHGIESYRDEWSRTVSTARGIAAMAKEHAAVEAERTALATLLHKMSSGLRTTRQSVQQLSQQYATVQAALKAESSERAKWVSEDALKFEERFQEALRQKDDELQELQRQITELQTQTQKLIVTHRPVGGGGSGAVASSALKSPLVPSGTAAVLSSSTIHRDPATTSGSLLLGSPSHSAAAASSPIVDKRSSIRRSMLFDL